MPDIRDIEIFIEWLDSGRESFLGRGLGHHCALLYLLESTLQFSRFLRLQLSHPIFLVETHFPLL